MASRTAFSASASLARLASSAAWSRRRETTPRRTTSRFLISSKGFASGSAAASASGAAAGSAIGSTSSVVGCGSTSASSSSEAISSGVSRGPVTGECTGDSVSSPARTEASSAVVASLSKSESSLLQSASSMNSCVGAQRTRGAIDGLRRGVLSLLLMPTMLGMSSVASTSPRARQVRCATRALRWGFSPWVGVGHTGASECARREGRALQERAYSWRFIRRFCAREEALWSLIMSRSASKSKAIGAIISLEVGA